MVLVVKPNNYLATFKVKTFADTINQTIKTWNKSLENGVIIDQEDINHLKQQITFNHSVYSYKWKIISINDSISKVKIYISDVDHSLKNNITIEHKPFEIFYNNPNLGGNDLVWKAEIFMPIIQNEL